MDNSSFTGVKKEFYENGQPLYDAYYENGKKHRIGDPAYIVYGLDGYIMRKSYYENGKLHRIGGPAVISYYENGNIESEIYYENGKCYRIGGASQIYYYEIGNIKCKCYAVFNQMEGFIEIWYYPDGIISDKKYYKNGQKHRIKGPAITKNWGDVARWNIMNEVIEYINNF